MALHTVVVSYHGCLVVHHTCRVMRSVMADQTEISFASTPYVCEIGNLSRPDGSAIFCQGSTSVQAAVYGPTDVRIQKEIVDKAHIEVIYKPKIGLPSAAEKRRENIIKGTCEGAILGFIHPRTSISLTIQELEDRGSLLACAINAVCLALINSGVEMRFLFAAVCCVVIGDEVIVHPTIKQEKEADVIATFVFDSQRRDILSCDIRKAKNEAQLQIVHDSCRKASESIFKFFRATVEKTFVKEPHL